MQNKSMLFTIPKDELNKLSTETVSRKGFFLTDRNLLCPYGEGTNKEKEEYILSNPS